MAIKYAAPPLRARIETLFALRVMNCNAFRSGSQKGPASEGIYLRLQAQGKVQSEKTVFATKLAAILCKTI